MIALVGGRVVPSFTRNWLAKQGSKRLPAPFGFYDKACLILLVVALIAWVLGIHDAVTGYLLLAAFAAHGIRLARWRGYLTWREPLVLVLHAGYGWLVVELGLLGVAVLDLAAFSELSATHALSVGAVSTMTLAVMTRASLGHSGQALTAHHRTSAIYLMIIWSGALRVLAGPLDPGGLTVIGLAAVLWSGAFLLFVWAYGPLLAFKRKSE
ncbi:MAG: NnrS family protein [Rhodospirillaceae bacterium]|jgi:uncharacterized protein involved in response to NO|nr:NnrS family protein [Rhodospirillaceae bacterium]MBT6205956.1 NnrS family protein [Rhodospirillaceae bacterium]MBT6510988.1 NnrS family protein [Rhodospirillaceae bacterium]MBT7611763.1 NnrS family protein [Rhodospirillaceae bacterium]